MSVANGPAISPQEEAMDRFIERIQQQYNNLMNNGLPAELAPFINQNQLANIYLPLIAGNDVLSWWAKQLAANPNQIPSSRTEKEKTGLGRTFHISQDLNGEFILIL